MGGHRPTPLTPRSHPGQASGPEPVPQPGQIPNDRGITFNGQLPNVHVALLEVAHGAGGSNPSLLTLTRTLALTLRQDDRCLSNRTLTLTLTLTSLVTRLSPRPGHLVITPPLAP